MQDSKQAVLAAADRLVDAFGQHDREAYFAAFSPQASFIFHNLDRRLASRAEYEAEWRLWESRDGFRVLSCVSTDRDVQLLGDVAIFTHAVRTELRFGDSATTSDERETIVFARSAAGTWIAIHEHLSARS